uniref:Uncharacterized protein n=1 Tax=Echinococcus granulosus TaxID=6210 RepID=A0A068WQY1_ECHGR|nr:hypothetical protein EgrG_000226700 [Echinococcus granulosus]
MSPHQWTSPPYRDVPQSYGTANNRNVLCYMGLLAHIYSSFLSSLPPYYHSTHLPLRFPVSELCIPLPRCTSLGICAYTPTYLPISTRLPDGFCAPAVISLVRETIYPHHNPLLFFLRA